MESKTDSAAIRILIDHNIEGWGTLLWNTLMTEGWADLCQIEMLMFADVGLDYDSNDREVWRFAQANDMILLTANRNMIGKDSLEQTLREENTPDSLPVITIGRAESLEDSLYREKCAERLLEVVLYPKNYLGIARLFIP